MKKKIFSIFWLVAFLLSLVGTIWSGFYLKDVHGMIVSRANEIAPYCTKGLGSESVDCTLSTIEYEPNSLASISMCRLLMLESDYLCGKIADIGTTYSKRILADNISPKESIMDYVKNDLSSFLQEQKVAYENYEKSVPSSAGEIFRVGTYCYSITSLGFEQFAADPQKSTISLADLSADIQFPHVTGLITLGLWANFLLALSSVAMLRYIVIIGDRNARR